MKDHQTVISIFGSAGGVAKSVLSILNHSANDTKDPIHHLITNSAIHLIDYKQKEPLYYQSLFPHLTNRLHNLVSRMLPRRSYIVLSNVHETSDPAFFI